MKSFDGKEIVKKILKIVELIVKDIEILYYFVFTSCALKLLFFVTFSVGFFNALHLACTDGDVLQKKRG